MTGLETAFLLNPPRRRRAKHRKGRARRSRNARGWFSKRGKFKRGLKRTLYSHRKGNAPRHRRRRRRHARASNPAQNPRRRRSYRRRGHRRSRNPGIGGMSLAFPAQVLPFRIPLPGIVGDIANGVVQGVAAGAVVIGGYMVSGALVNFIVSPAKAAAADAAGDALVGKWARPLLFGATAGLIGGIVAMIAPKNKRVTFGLLAAAGPGIRALGGIIKAVMAPPTEAGIMQDVYALATGLADYLQVGDFYEAGMGDQTDEEIADYLQVGDEGGDEGGDGMNDSYEAGMGVEEEASELA